MTPFSIEDQQLLAWHAEGATPRLIATRLGRSLSDVSTRLEKALRAYEQLTAAPSPHTEAPPRPLRARKVTPRVRTTTGAAQRLEAVWVGPRLPEPERIEVSPREWREQREARRESAKRAREAAIEAYNLSRREARERASQQHAS